ncbi:MAG: hypothetical protein DDT35_00393 [Firmicutes bacterium]|nr:hypothetical protein [Bacillota bacterium]
MKIDPKANIYLRTAESRPPLKKGTAVVAANQGDSIAISLAARLLQAGLEMEEPFAGDKVLSIKNDVQRGEYNPSMARLAEAMVRGDGRAPGGQK